MTNNFNKYPICAEIKEALSLLHYEEPTRVQEAVLEYAFSEKDLIVKSETGSGKTAAFGIPLCEMADWQENKPQALVLAPTRELAVQIREEIFHIGRFKRLKVPAVYGRAPFNYQANELKLKSHIVVGTPGRVMDHIERGTLQTDQIKYLVIDEADEMLKMGFIEQIKAILQCLPEEHRTMLFSATFGKEMQELAAEYMKEVKVIEIESGSLTVDLVEQIGYFSEASQKFSLLRDVLIIENPESCIIFCNTQEEADKLYDRLNRVQYTCRKIHGGMEQNDRFRIMEDLKGGKFRYLVATDVAARGIDIGAITHVVNYEVPRLRESYVHRIGRTARMGQTGCAITFFEPHQQTRLEELQKYTGSEIKIREIPSQEEILLKEEAFWDRIGRRPEKREKKGAVLNSQITKLHINAGKKTKMRPTDVVGTICGIDGVTAEDIGIIEIQNISTFVEILNGKGKYVCKELQQRNIKGRPRKVSIKE